MNFRGFAQDRFATTTIKKIVDAAGTSTALVFHCFKSKESLWRHVEGVVFEALTQKTDLRCGSLEHFENAFSLKSGEEMNTKKTLCQKKYKKEKSL